MIKILEENVIHKVITMDYSSEQVYRQTEIDVPFNDKNFIKIKLDLFEKRFDILNTEKTDAIKLEWLCQSKNSIRKDLDIFTFNLICENKKLYINVYEKLKKMEQGIKSLQNIIFEKEDFKTIDLIFPKNAIIGACRPVLYTQNEYETVEIIKDNFGVNYTFIEKRDKFDITTWVLQTMYGFKIVDHELIVIKVNGSSIESRLING